MIDLDCRRLNLPANLAVQYAAPIEFALAQMAEVEAGEYVNRDENKPVPATIWIADAKTAKVRRVADGRAGFWSPK